MGDEISQAQRREVRARANQRCEYCRMPEWALLAGCEVDHIISRKHEGITDVSNLALSCARCNRAKGTDIGSLSPTGALIRFFNPRIDRWEDHFTMRGATMVGLSDIGRVTIKVLQLNSDERLLERAALHQIGEFPVDKKNG
jgi:hypothetical protein